MIAKSDRQAARERRRRSRRKEVADSAWAVRSELAGHLVALGFENARLLHLGLPGELRSALCGREGAGEPLRTAAGLTAGEVCKGCRTAAAAIVVVGSPDPGTGVAVDTLAAASWYGASRITTALSKRFCERVLAGEKPPLIFDGKEDCPVQAGEVHILAESVWITIDKVVTAPFRPGKPEHRINYTVTDDRPVLVRRVPPMHEPPDLDPCGKPRKLTPVEEAATRIASGYTQDTRQAVPGTAPEVDVEYRRVLDVRKRHKEAANRKERSPMQDAEADVKNAAREMRELAKRAVKMGLDPVEVMAPIFRSIDEAHADLSSPPFGPRGSEDSVPALLD